MPSESLDRLRALALPDASVYAFAVGESKLATGARRLLVDERGVPKRNVTFCGYWRAH
ncbi:SIP domain-containing protein [Agromyces lapidis]|uniref:SIP domain-containing protein n=1 Tax=Agromyces lapidis TaxID=279574 RepID=A0ABV5SRZ9_9MICO|nr:SIP domain-containing protein [Agromyces lapidis]